MTSEEKIMVLRLLDGWEGALHNVDTLFQVVQAIPDWQEQCQHWKNDPLRIQATTERFRSLREAVQAIVEGGQASSLLAQALAKVNQSLN